MSDVAEKPRIMIDDFFDIIVANKASDLHMQEGQPPKMRLHGDIKRIHDTVLTSAEMDADAQRSRGPEALGEIR